MTLVLFVITTTLGALTGVGIWLVSALIAPFGIGSLLRVFFFAWFSEWLVFVSEVVLIMIYFLTWRRWSQGAWKTAHIALGAFLSVFSWFTMAIIVGILGFMMGTGTWTLNHSFWSAFLNPLYLPQLAFRTTYALMTAGLCVWFMIFFFTQKGSEFRARAVRFVAIWILAFVPFCIAAGYWYWRVVPANMLANINVALLTQAFMQWHATLAKIMAAAVGAIVLAAVVGIARPRAVSGVALLIPFILGVWLLGHFERVREFVRKPYVIADYMYSNGVRVNELPVFQRDGILTYATYVTNHRVTDENLVAAGQDVWMVACSRCHTTNGLNSTINKFTNLYGSEPWDPVAMKAFIANMHVTRTFMPPFPGSDRELDALVAYIRDLQVNRRTIGGAQTAGIPAPQPPVQSTTVP